MNISQKVGVYLILFVPAVIVAAGYGAVHDQISYTFSPEYFTRFKFVQFGIPWAQESHRLGAAVVGALATWWMGVFVFFILGLFGFMLPNAKLMAKELLFSFVIVIFVALATGIGGLLYGYTAVNASNIDQYIGWIRPGVTDAVQFIRVGFMHNASYLGGLTGLLSGVIYLFFAKKRYNKMVQQDS